MMTALNGGHNNQLKNQEMIQALKKLKLLNRIELAVSANQPNITL